MLMLLPLLSSVGDRLEALGHARREANPADRRSIVVTPSPGSVGQAMGILTPMIRDVDAALDGFDPDEQEVIAQYLERVVAAYRAHVPA